MIILMYGPNAKLCLFIVRVDSLSLVSLVNLKSIYYVGLYCIYYKIKNPKFYFKKKVQGFLMSMAVWEKTNEFELVRKKKMTVDMT